MADSVLREITCPPLASCGCQLRSCGARASAGDDCKSCSLLERCFRADATDLASAVVELSELPTATQD